MTSLLKPHLNFDQLYGFGILVWTFSGAFIDISKLDSTLIYYLEKNWPAHASMCHFCVPQKKKKILIGLEHEDEYMTTTPLKLTRYIAI